MEKRKINVTWAAFVVSAFLFLPCSLTAADAGKDVSAMVEKAGAVANMADKININTASIEMLAKIPGIGPTISSAIETYRNANGAFKSLNDLTNVEGIDADLLEKIKPFLSI